MNFYFGLSSRHRQSSDITGKSSNLTELPELGSQGSQRAPLNFQTNEVSIITSNHFKSLTINYRAPLVEIRSGVPV